MINKLGLLISVVVLTTFWGCKKEDVVLDLTDPYTRPINLDLPIFQAKIKAVDLVEGLDTTQFISIDEDSLIHVQIDTSFSAGYEDIIEFGDTLGLTVPFPLIPTKALEIPFMFGDTIPAALAEGQKFDYVTIKTGQMEVEVTASDGFTGQYTITFPEIFQTNGNILVFASDIGTNPDPIDVAGGTIKFFQNDADVSSFSFIIDGTASHNGGSTGGELLVTVRMVNFLVDEIYGYFGRINVIEQKQEMDFDFLGDFDFTDMIELKKVDLKIDLESYFGIPVTLFIDSMVFKNSTSGEFVELNEVISIPSATKTGTTISPSSKSINLDLADAINLGPDKIYYEVNGWINYDGDILPNGDPVQNFLINDGKSEIEASILIDIPFWFKITDYNRSDIINFDIKNIINDETTIDYLEELNLYFDFDNGLPFNIMAQAYAVNAAGDTVDALFNPDQYILKSPPINNEGKAEGAELNLVDIKLTHDQVKNMYDNDVKFLHLETTVSSGGTIPEFVQLHTSYNLDIKLSLSIKGSVSTN